MQISTARTILLLFFIISLSGLCYSPSTAQANEGIERLYATKLRKYFPKGRNLIAASTIKTPQAILGVKMVAAKKIVGFDIAGTYHCTEHFVGDEAKPCSEPLLTIRNNSDYYLGNEKGAYTLDGSTVILGNAMFSSRGVISDDLQSLVFSYYNAGNEHLLLYTRAIELPTAVPEEKPQPPSFSLLVSTLQAVRPQPVIIPSIDASLHAATMVAAASKKVSAYRPYNARISNGNALTVSLRQDSSVQSKIAIALFKDLLLSKPSPAPVVLPQIIPVVSQVAGVKILSFPSAKPRQARLPACDPTILRTEQPLCK